MPNAWLPSAEPGEVNAFSASSFDLGKASSREFRSQIVAVRRE